MKRSKYSNSLWIGNSIQDSPDGFGVLHTVHDKLGLIKVFEGHMQHGRFVSGTLYKVQGDTVYKSFEGFFDGDGTLFDVDGLVIFCGPVSNGIPYGFGTGLLHMNDILCDFTGTYMGVYKTGTLTFETCRWIGDLHPVLGWPSGRGLYSDGDIHLEGLASIDGARMTFQGRGPFPDIVHSFFPKLRFVNGSFVFTRDFRICLHGLCAIVFRCGHDLLKVVATFDMESIQDSFDVYKISESDSVFETDFNNGSISGQKLATIDVSGSYPKLVLYEDNKLTYDGSGLFAFKSNFFGFWEDGHGTTFEDGHPKVTADYDMGKLKQIHMLYDTNGKLLWTLTEWSPFPGSLNGTGMVFSEDGNPMYPLTFDDGQLVSERSFWKQVPKVSIKTEGIDPITKEPFRKGRLGVKLHASQPVVYSLQTLKDYWKVSGFGKDPLSDRYCFRMTLVKFT